VDKPTIGENGGVPLAASAERVRQLEESLAALNTQHLSAAVHLSERIDQLRYDQSEMRAHLLREAAFLRGMLVAQSVLVAAYVVGALDTVLRAGAVAAVIWVTLYAASQTRFVQRKWRDLRIWWDTYQIRRGRRG
jgi:hypothetical protein